MNTLFPVEPPFPSGFRYIPQFITGEEEQLLLEACRQQELHPFRFQGYEAKRRVASFGQDWSFEQQVLKQGQPIPGPFLPLVEKVAAITERPSAEFAELLVTHYPAGSVINWHRDAPPFDLVAGVSLLTDCTFRLRPYDKEEHNRKSILSFPVQRRSLYLMQGESRSAWQHSIATVKQDRYSITLRTLRK
jgi:alkylated DNA repair dioxygenase AlkB